MHSPPPKAADGAKTGEPAISAPATSPASSTSPAPVPSPAVSPRTIAFAGLGAMGDPMVRHLVKAGHTVRLFDLRRDVAEALAAEIGATASASAAEAGDGAEVVITMVPNADAARAAILGEDGNGLSARVAPGALIVDMSSSYPPETVRIGRELATRGLPYMDAPVSGGVRRAVAGTLAIMLGGDDPAALDAAEPVLSAMGTVFRTGPLGSGHATKALNNYLSAITTAATAEALLVGERFGLDPKVMLNVINHSTGRSNASEVKYPAVVNERNFAAGFAAKLMVKDLAAAKGLMEELGPPLPLMSANYEVWRTALERLGDGIDHMEVYRYLEDVYAGT